MRSGQDEWWLMIFDSRNNALELGEQLKTEIQTSPMGRLITVIRAWRSWDECFGSGDRRGCSIDSNLKDNKDSFFRYDGSYVWAEACGELALGKEILMGSKKELTYVLDLRYYSTISSIVPQLRYNYKFDC